MRSARWAKSALAAIAMCAVISAHADGDAVAGKQKGYTCLGCHAIPNYNNVYPTYRVPRLGGQHPEYIIAALKEYQSGERTHGTMHAQASTLSDQDMADIAAYLSAAPGPGSK